MNAVRPGPGLDLAEVLKGPWAPGVVARYLTAGWASVDVLDVTTPSVGAEKHRVSAVCRGEGCTWDAPAERDFYVAPDAGAAEEDSPYQYRQYLFHVKCRAQRHAEDCRAMHRPQGNVLEAEPPTPVVAAVPPRRQIEPRWPSSARGHLRAEG